MHRCLCVPVHIFMQFGLKGDMLPKSPIELDVFNGGQILNYDFRDMLKRKELHAVEQLVQKLHVAYARPTTQLHEGLGRALLQHWTRPSRSVNAH